MMGSARVAQEVGTKSRAIIMNTIMPTRRNEWWPIHMKRRLSGVDTVLPRLEFKVRLCSIEEFWGIKA